MIHNKSKNQLLMTALVVGFFVGILYENIYKSGAFFENERMENFHGLDYKSHNYVWYLIKMRLLPLSIVAFLQNLRWRRIVILLINVSCGFLFGRMLVAAIIAQGIKGIVLSMIILFPHMLFYAIAYAIFILHLYNERKRKWKRSQIAAIVFFLILGILSEVYVNTWILKMVF